MFSHVFLGVTDFERALAFYGPLMAALGIELRFCERDRPWAGWQAPGAPRPLFLIGRPFDGQPHAAGNGQMVAFLAASRDMVRTAHRTALANGGTSDGTPALRPEYHANYYGCYFRDPDGNKICVACHSPDAESDEVDAYSCLDPTFQELPLCHRRPSHDAAKFGRATPAPR